MAEVDLDAFAVDLLKLRVALGTDHSGIITHDGAKEHPIRASERGAVRVDVVKDSNQHELLLFLGLFESLIDGLVDIPVSVIAAPCWRGVAGCEARINCRSLSRDM